MSTLRKLVRYSPFWVCPDPQHRRAAPEARSRIGESAAAQTGAAARLEAEHDNDDEDDEDDDGLDPAESAKGSAGSAERAKCLEEVRTR